MSGWGETGTVLHPAVRWALHQEGDVLIDVGYGVAGSGALHLLAEPSAATSLQIVAVINTARPLTAKVEDIVNHVRSLGKVDGLLNNTHLGTETTPELIQAGARLVAAAARVLKLPLVATAVMAELAPLIGEVDSLGNPVRVIKRYMPRAFW